MSADKNRDEFEAHWRSVRPAKSAARELVRRDDQPQVYVCDSPNRHWVTWQASRKAALEEAANVCLLTVGESDNTARQLQAQVCASSIKRLLK